MKKARGKLQQLLNHIVGGEEDQAAEMVKQDPGLLLEKGIVTDYSGRKFKNVTAFQCAAWARDQKMWKRLLACLPVTEEGEAIRAKLLIQCHELNTSGITYEWEGKKYVASNKYDFTSLLTAYQDYFDYNKTVDWDNFTYSSEVDNELTRLWLNIGKIQRSLPAHVMQEYFHERRAFVVNETTPLFNDEEDLSRSVLFSDGTSLYPLTEKVGLGYEYAIVRGRGNFAFTSTRGGGDYDAAAVNHLCEVINDEYMKLCEQLQMTQRVFLNKP